MVLVTVLHIALCGKVTLTRNTLATLWRLFILTALSCFALPARAGNYIEKQEQYPTSIPDTGQDLCYDTVKAIPCPNPGEPFHGQDASYSINTPRYTNHNTGDLATVTDQITGLTWQLTPDTLLKTWSEAIDYTNSLNLSGFNDWRLPSKQELQTIFSFGEAPGQLKQKVPKSQIPESRLERSCAWTISNLAFPSLDAKTICQPDKQGGLSSKYKKQYVYAVRGPSYMTGHYKTNGNQIVTDQYTGLMWQSTEILPQKWENALAYCEELQLGGFNDWRLPTLKELMTLVNEENIFPSIDTSFFPATRTAAYWTSTTYSGHPAFAWYIRFDNGLEYNGGYKGRRYFVRAVRSTDITRAVQKTVAKPLPVAEEQYNEIPAVKTEIVTAKNPVETTTPPEPVKQVEPVKVTPPDAGEKDIFEPYPLDYQLYEE